MPLMIGCNPILRESSVAKDMSNKYFKATTLTTRHSFLVIK